MQDAFSQRAVGVAAFITVAAVAVTPMAPAASTAEVSPTKAAVTLSSLENPLTAIIATGETGLKYLFNRNYSEDPVVNWGEPARIGPEWNALLQQVSDPVQGFLPHITVVGLIPNMIQVPNPVVTQLAANWLGYSRELIASIPGGISAISAAAMDVMRTVAARGSAVFAAFGTSLQEITRIFNYQLSVLSASVRNSFAGVATALAARDFPDAWNAAVAGFLSPSGVPGTVLNLTIGAGVQTDRADPTTFIASGRSVVQTVREKVGDALTALPESGSAAVVGPRAAAAVGSSVTVGSKVRVPRPAAATTSEADAGAKSPAAKTRRHAAAGAGSARGQD
jgi:hypothetical protein